MTEINIKKLTKMCYLELKDGELEKLSNSVSNILDWCENLESVNTDNVDSMFTVSDVFNKGIENLRDDTPTTISYQQDIIKSAPDHEDIFIAVPKVIE